MLLLEFLENKPLYYTEIDYTRMPRVYQTIQEHFYAAKIIHIIGTNGKGTTGRFLATALFNKGFKVGHYTSPHIFKFNERIWIDGSDTQDNVLEEAHMKLQSILSKEDAASLSYFEYTTFLAMLVFNSCEYIVLEAGLGGIHDATAVFEKALTLVTPIDYDHEAFLGNTIKNIALEKLNAVQKDAIIARQKHDKVYDVCSQLELENDISILDFKEYITSEDKQKIRDITQTYQLVKYLENNLSLAIAGLNFFSITYKVSDFKDSKLFGRLTKIKDNIVIDVGHNVLAAESILKALLGKKYILVYNTYEDKNYSNILSTLKPIIKHVEIIEVNDKRIENPQKIKNVLTDLEIECRTYKAIEKKQNYLVFGSFRVVEEFMLRENNE